MVRKTDQNIILVRKFKRNIKKIVKLDKLILFGSRARGTFNTYSDFDLIIVSDDFKDIPWYKRPAKLYVMWKEDYPVEILCYTPEEFKKRANKIGIISEALNKGTEI